MIKQENVNRLMKVFFSAVIIQLLYISLCLWHYRYGTPADITVPLHKIPEMLEYAAASCAISTAGGFILTFADELLTR